MLYPLNFCRSVGFILGIALLSQTVLAGPPTVSKPGEAIPIHNFMEEAKKYQELAIADEQACIKLYEQAKKSGPKADLVGKISMHSKRVKRTAHRLISLGEPSGHEFLKRSEHHIAWAAECFNAFQGLPIANGFRQKAIAHLQKNTPKRKTKVQEVLNKMSSDPFGAQQLLDAAVDEHESVASVLHVPERGPFSELMEPENKLEVLTKELREKQVNAAANEAAQKIAAESDAFIIAIKNAAQSVSGGNGKWADQSLPAHELNDAIFKAGLGVLAHVQKAIATQYLFEESIGASMSASRPPRNVDPQWVARLENLRIEMSKAAIAVMEKDLSESSPSQALTKIANHANVLGKYAHKTRHEHWSKAFDDALQASANRLGVANKLVAYQAATSDVLAWKERFASQQEVLLTSQVGSLKDVFTKASAFSPTEPGYLIAQQGVTPHPQFYNASYDAIPSTAKRLGDKSFAVVRGVYRLDGDSASWISHWDNFIYASIPKGLATDVAADQLAKSLWTDASHPPLTVKAASAIHSAKRGDGLIVGGTVDNFAVEGAIARAMTVPDAELGFGGVDAPLNFPRSLATPRSTVSLRVKLTPAWYRHRYFAVVTK